MDVILSIAGSDSCAGAGIQADLKTIAAQDAYGVTALTAVTAQNTQGVQAAEPVALDLLQRQLESLFADLPIAAVKTGMLPTTAHVRLVADFLRAHPVPHVVVDPVMVATSGDRLQEDDAAQAMLHELLPVASVATPNREEFERLVQAQHAGAARRADDIAAVARALLDVGCGAVVITGGDGTSEQATDVLVDDTGAREFHAARVATPFTHGTGCTFSAALACHLARGVSLQRAVAEAKSYVTHALQGAVTLAPGRGATDHMAVLRRNDDVRLQAPERSGRTVGGVSG